MRRRCFRNFPATKKFGEPVVPQNTMGAIAIMFADVLNFISLPVHARQRLLRSNRPITSRILGGFPSVTKEYRCIAFRGTDSAQPRCNGGR
jgi:hypothetical protein